MYSRNVIRGIVVIFTVVSLIILAGAMDVSLSQQKGEIKISVGTAVVDTDATGIGAKEFCRLVEEKTKGRVKTEYFGSSQLGADRELIEQMKLGTLDIFIGPTAPQSGFVPDMRILDIPYLFDSREAAAKILNGDLGNILLDKWASQGVKGLAWSDNGFRHMIVKTKAIKTPDDLVGMRIRIMEAPVYRALFKTLDANPTPIPWTELYTALQTNLVDGFECPIDPIGTTKLYKIAPYISTTSHVLSNTTYLINLAKYNRLPSDIQKTITEAAREAGAYCRQLVTQKNDQWFKDIAADGGIITEVKIELFQEKTKDMGEKFGKEINEELYKSIKRAQGK
jgi:TRAP-type transport system periplasmic protein